MLLPDLLFPQHDTDSRSSTIKNVNASVNDVQVVAVDRPGGAAVMNIEKTF
jgi:hypothetical protein